MAKGVASKVKGNNVNNEVNVLSTGVYKELRKLSMKDSRSESPPGTWITSHRGAILH